MKRSLIILATLLSMCCYSQKYKLLEINAKWNAKNNLKIDKLGGINIEFAWLEQQTEKFRSDIKSVPVLVLIKDNKPIYQWSGGLNLKLEITEKKFNKIFNKLKR